MKADGIERPTLVTVPVDTACVDNIPEASATTIRVPVPAKVLSVVVPYIVVPDALNNAQFTAFDCPICT